MKVLITTFTYLPNKDGVSEACRAMAEGLTSLGWEVSVATSMGSEQAGCPDSVRFNGVNVVHFFPNIHPFNSPLEKQEVDRFYNFVRAGSFDVVVNQCWDARLARYIQVIHQSLGVPFVMVSHGYTSHMMDLQKNPLKGWGMWVRGILFTFKDFPRMLRRSKKVVFLSEKRDWKRFFDHRAAIAMHHPGIHVIANGINLKQYPKTDEGFRERYGVGASLMALCVANYSERKNQLLAVKSFREANVADSVLVLVGSVFNDYTQKVRDLDRALSPLYPACRVLFIEKISRAETFAAYVACDLFLLTAKAETQPIVLIEAMAAGKPWISTDTGCVSEMAGGVVCRSRKQLSHAIQSLLRDESERHRLGELGKAEASAKHDATRTASKFHAVLKDALKS